MPRRNAIKALSTVSAGSVSFTARSVSSSLRVPSIATIEEDHSQVQSNREQQRMVTKAYMHDYVKAAKRKDISSAMEALSKAAASGYFCHVEIPHHTGCAPGGLAPMSAVVPSFAWSSEDNASNIIMPFWVNLPIEGAGESMMVE